MSKKFNKKLALIALVSAMALGGSTGLVEASSSARSVKSATSRGWRLPTGTKLFLGTVKSIKGTQLTISRSKGASLADVTINTNSTTTYLGGSLSSIVIGTHISGVGVKQSDGTFNAVSVRINPAMKASEIKQQRKAGIRPFAGIITNNSGSSIIIINQRHGKASSTLQTINLAPTTAFTTGAVTNLTVGSSVAGIGTINSDKSLTALKISPNASRTKPLAR